MANYAKWIGGGLGWAFGGPIGALIGFVVGNMMDGKSSAVANVSSQTTQGDFVMSLLVLIAAVMKADGKILKSELDYVKQNFLRTFGADQTRTLIRALGDLSRQEIPLGEVCVQISRHMDYSSRLELLHLLFGISQADGVISTEEINTIEYIRKQLGIKDADYLSIKGMFVKDTTSAYKILEIEPTATDEEVKKAYRRMALKYHPDKVAYLGEEIAHDAKVKFQKVNEAYETIKKERNLN
ncbi:MAG: DnaJ domain-containing protein [Bacteroidales bacterium]|nr:DnaJ domain-containing protein [Bacteroidales bacterium]